MSPPAAASSAIPVAIIGIGCRFPGAVDGPDAFWRFLIEGRDAIGEIPSDRIDLAHFFDPRPATPGRIMTRWGGFLDGIEQFDAGFFGISPREAERLDPQQRLMLETVWEALEDAGQRVPSLAGSRTGVFVGQWLSDFEARLFADPERADFLMTTGSGRYATSGRVSYLLGLQGPSLTLDTACSSSLVAVHLAARSIRDGESDLALAGGVNVILQPHISVAYSQSRMMAPDGHCKFGDASGDGYVRSEGAGIIVLKALDRAVADGDRIYAVIRGGAINNDGRCSGSMGTPARAGQEALLRIAYADAGICPGKVGYIEAHGTGTRAGDPVELGALGAVLGEGREAGRRARVGSVKTNFGHTEGAAGVAGLIKLALCLHHRSIPASLNCRELNPAVPWSDLPLEIAREAAPWEGESRVGGVSAFGIAGTNAHIVLQSAPPAATAMPVPAVRELRMLPLSARCSEALRALATRHAHRIDEAGASGEAQLAQLCGEAAHRRGAMECRAVFIAADAASMRAALTRYAGGEPAAAEGTAPVKPPRIAFIVPGQGAQWTGMARQLLASEPVFRDAIERCDAAASRHVDWSIQQQIALDKDSPGYLMDRIDVIQPVLVALAIAYSHWLAAQGIRADAVVGHSMGEVGSAYIAGVLDLEAAMRIICRRSALMREQSGRGAMALVDLSIADAEQRIGTRADRVGVAVSNSPRSSVISGDPALVDEILAECERDGVFCRRVNVDVASHSPQMQEPAARLRAELHDLTTSTGQVALYSTVMARRAQGNEFGADYWAQNLRRPVRFADAVTAMLADGISVFIELGPHPVLLPAVQQTAQAAASSAVITIGCGRRNEPEQFNLLAAAAAAWAAGVEIDWHALQPRIAAIDLPRYPWQRERHWVKQAMQRPAGAPAGSAPAELPEEFTPWLHRLEWVPAKNGTDAGTTPPERWLVLDAPERSAASLVETLRTQGAQAQAVSPGSLSQALSSCTGITGVVWTATENAGAAWELVQLVRRCAQGGGAATPRLWVITTGAQSVTDAPRASVNVQQGAVWGAGRVLAEEHPDLWGGLIDLDPEAGAASNARALAAELLASDGLAQVALRDTARFGLQVVALDSASQQQAPAAWRADGAYLITGGLGAIGQRVAHELISQGARRLVLLGRSAVPPRNQWNAIAQDSADGLRIAAIRRMEAAGAAVHLLQADAGDAEALASALQQYEQEAWPPIIGVVHAAGITDSRLAAQMDQDTFDRVINAKLTSALHLDRHFPQARTFVVFSSIMAFLGASGTVNYAAANAGLDALVQARRARGAGGLAIQWGPWQSLGLLSGAVGERNMAEIASLGISSFTPDAGVAVFRWLSASGADRAIVMPVDWAALQRSLRGRSRQLFESRFGSGGAEVSSAEPLANRLSGATPEQRRVMLEGLVRDAVSKVLGIAPQRIDARRPLGQMGLSSLMSMEVRNRLEQELNRPLSASLTWNYPTIEQIVRFLAGDALAAAAPGTAIRPPAAAQPADGNEDLQQIAALSDEEAARELLGLGAGGA